MRLMITAFLFLLGGSQTLLAENNEGVVHQLRVYEIFEGNKQAFHDRFRDHAMRIMARYDFRIVAMWEAKSETRTEFVYLLEWPDRETMQDRWKRFMADAEWADIKRRTAAEHGRLVGEIQERVMQPTTYSPAPRLLNGQEEELEPRQRERTAESGHPSDLSR